MHVSVLPSTRFQLATFLCLGSLLTTSRLPSAARPAPKKKAASSTLRRKPLSVIGRVSTNGGKPISGAELSIYGTTARGDRSHFATTTNASGLYSQRVPDGIYGVGAQLTTRFNGKNYRFNLHPEDGKTGITHDAAPGILKNFRWKISGLKPRETAGAPGAYNEGPKYYGGYISVSSEEKGFGGVVYFPKGATIVINLTPRGKLIDGSPARVKTFRRRFDADVIRSLNWYLTDVPVGLYSLSARLILADGNSQPIKVKRSMDFQDPYRAAVNVDFEPTTFGDLQMMQITLQTQPD
ncbi:MAG: hypothetical protein JWN98_212 [Abditibacteriota bacterium]|jgi:hypothetical protein|nr:hypothetical protein [Abditibacteriota bacterium]